MEEEKKDFVVEGGCIGVTIDGIPVSFGMYRKWNSGLRTFNVMNRKLFDMHCTVEEIKKTYKVTEVIYDEEEQDNIQGHREEREGGI